MIDRLALLFERERQDLKKVSWFILKYLIFYYRQKKTRLNLIKRVF
jgi:hypothetical protein